MKKLLLVCTVLAALVFGALPASAGSPVAFTGYGSGPATLTIVGGSGLVSSSGPYTLTAPFSGTGTYSLNFTTGSPPACNVGTTTTSGSVVIGSGSSHLTWSVSGVICADTNPADDVDYLFGANLAVTGATGSYTGYTGSGSMGAQFLSGGDVQLTVSGTVTPP